MKKNQLSILIPAYNSQCCRLVRDLYDDAIAAGLKAFEIVVAEDGSDDIVILRQHKQAFRQLPSVRHIVRQENVGRSAIRNFLAQEARYEWLLFIDSHMSFTAASLCDKGSFLRSYLSVEGELLYGGYVVEASDNRWRTFLRFRYEKASANINVQHFGRCGASNDFSHFHTANFLIRRDIMLAHPFDEKLYRYGYEDDLFGRELSEMGLSLVRVDNPLTFTTFEENAVFVNKTEQALITLHELAGRMEGFSRLLVWCKKMERWHLVTPYLYIYRWRKEKWRATLCGDSPSLLIFQLYKLGFFLSLSR